MAEQKTRRAAKRAKAFARPQISDTVSVVQLKARQGELLSRAERRGESFLITRNGRACAVLGPADAVTSSRIDRLPD